MYSLLALERSLAVAISRSWLFCIPELTFKASLGYKGSDVFLVRFNCLTWVVGFFSASQANFASSVGTLFLGSQGFKWNKSVLNDSDYFKVLERSGSSHCHPRLFFSPWLPNIWFWMQNLFSLVLYILKNPKSFIQLFVLNSFSQVKFHFLSRFTSKKQMLNIGVWVKSLLFIYILLCLIFRLHIVNS